jgi:peptide/nickel transport system substrate-binding protein
MKARRLVRNSTLLVVLLLLVNTVGLAAGFAGAAPASMRQDSSEPQSGGTLRMAISEEPDQLDPARTIELLAGRMMDKVYDALVYIGEDGLPQPWVAESWDISEDGQTITFNIRDGIQFHDGTPLDADAIKFSYERILDPEMAAPYRDFLGTMTSVEAPDASTVIMEFSAPYAAFFTNGATIGIVSPAAVKELGDDFGHNPVGSGPFMFDSWDTGTKITFVRNPDYVNYRADDLNKGAAYVESIVYNVIPEAATQTAAFEAGELDVFNIPREDIARLSENPDIQIVTLKESDNINFIEFANEAPYNDPVFRKAVSYAIDRDSIVELAYQGNATPNQCPVPIGNAAYDADLCAEHGYTYDLDQARAVLEEAGWTDSNGDGTVEIDGEELEVTLWSYAPYPVQSKTIEIVQADLNEIGIGTDIQTIEFGAMQPMLESGEIGFDYMRWTFSDQSILSQLFESPGWVNQTSDPELDKLIQVADTTVDPEARLQASHAVIAYILDNAIASPVVSDWVQVGTAANVNDYHWDALNNERLNDVWFAS